MPVLVRPHLPACRVAGAGRKQASVLDGLRDLQSGPGGREVRGVDDLGLAVQPCPGRLSVGLEVFETKRRVGAKNGVARDPSAEGVLVGVEDEVRTGMAWWARPALISRQYCSTRTVMGITRVPPA